MNIFSYINLIGGDFMEENEYYEIKNDKTVNIIETVQSNIPQDEELYDLAELFKVFGDSTRIKILYALFASEELCVNDLAKIMNVSQSATSHQLRTLKTNKLVKYRRDGKTIYYSLADEHVRSILDQGMEHIEE